MNPGVVFVMTAPLIVVPLTVSWLAWRQARQSRSRGFSAGLTALLGVATFLVVYIAVGMAWGRFGLAWNYLVEECGPVVGTRAAWKLHWQGGSRLEADSFFRFGENLEENCDWGR